MRILYLTLLFTIFSGCMSNEFERQFSENFLPTEASEDGTACGTEEDVEVYRLNEVFFENDEILTFNVDWVFFSNGAQELPDELFYKRTADIAEFYKEADTGIEVEVNSIRQITTLPKEDSLVMEYITRIEYTHNNSQPINELRDGYRMNNYKIWHQIYGKPNVITLYVFLDRESKYAGIAGGIGSTFAGIALRYIETEYRTVEHEVGHIFGLYHPHTRDRSDTGCNPYTGDKVSDTFKSPNLKGIVSRDSCGLHENWEELVKQEWYESSNHPSILSSIPEEELDELIHNVMSYTKGSCRAGFADGQILRMRKTIETSQDLRRAVQGLGTPLQESLWAQTFE